MITAVSMSAVLIAGAVTAAAPGRTKQSHEIRNALVRVVAEEEEAGFAERFYARTNSGWKLILTGGSPLRPEPALKIDGNVTAGIYHTARVETNGGEQSMILEARGTNTRIRKTLRLHPDDPFVWVHVECDFDRNVSLEYLLSTYSFEEKGKPDFVFTPQLRPEVHDIIADHTFRSPALILQKGPNLGAIIPDVETLDGKQRACRAGADLQVRDTERPFISFGLLPWTKRGHVYYSHTDSNRASVTKGTVGYGFFVFVSASEAHQKGFQEVVRFHWRRSGHRNFLNPVGPQSERFDAYIRKAWSQFVPAVLLDTSYQGSPVTLLRQNRLSWSNSLPGAANDDNWFNVWFNSLRTAYGMYMFGVDSGDQQLTTKAIGNLNLALLAPQSDGIAPSIFYVDDRGGHWVADHAWGGVRNGSCYAMFHNAWTGYWMLQWAEILPERRAEILAFTGRFGEFLLRRQLPSGVIPSWYDPTTLEAVPELREENAETAGAALFLAELYRQTKDARYLEGAERAMGFIVAAILPEHKWFDYETFFSCSRKPLDFFDRFTGQYPQNTLSMHQAAEASRLLFVLTGKEKYRERGLVILDYLCLYQQVWSPRWLSRELFGGFGVQNTDGEWSDSRQGYFAVTLVKYYALTGTREYFERGIAALRAMFSLFESPESPRTAENYAHASADELAGVTGLHWGTGSSVVSIQQIRRWYGDAHVNIGGSWGAGIDGCRVTSVEVSGNVISVRLEDNLQSPRPVKLTFGSPVHESYLLTVNKVSLGRFHARDLEKGVDVIL